MLCPTTASEYGVPKLIKLILPLKTDDFEIGFVAEALIVWNLVNPNNCQL